MITVVVCDDEPAIRFALEEALEGPRTRVVALASAAEALARVEQGGVDVLLTDLVMPQMDGFALLAGCRQIDPELPVVMLTAQGSERAAVRAMKAGAYDYLRKPFAIDELRVVVARAAEARALRRTAAELAMDRACGRPIVGESVVFRRALDQARRVGRRDVTVLIRG